MKLEGGKISGVQLYFLAFGYIVGATILVSPTEYITQKYTWITIIIGLFEGLIFASIYLKLSSLYPGKSLIEIFQIVYGKILGQLISFFYLIFFFNLTTLNMRFLGDYFVILIMQETPLIIFLILIALLSASAVRNGIEVIARISLSIVAITTIFFINATLFLLKEMDFQNLFPLFDISATKIFLGSQVMSSIVFGELFILTMIIPYLTNHKTALKAVPLAIISGFVIIFSVSIQNVTVLGDLIPLYIYPVYQTTGLINIGDIFTRLTVLFTLGITITMFLRICLLYYVTIISCGQILNLKTYLPLVLPIGALLVVFSRILFESNIEQTIFGAKFFPILGVPFEVGIPLLTLILAMLKKNLTKKHN